MHSSHFRTRAVGRPNFDRRLMLLHDDRYPNASEFRPERFLNEDGTLSGDAQDPGVAAFGFGRR